MSRNNRHRNKPIFVRVTEEENVLIEERMKASHITNKSSYMRKMAIDGYIINVEMKEITEVINLLRYSSNNLNQIARHLNETGSIYKEDMMEIQNNYKGLWADLKEVLNKINMITKV
ncbi:MULTISPECIES: plasmid mobilization protein [unclassified Butyrivibrio]|uniref:plasmid mobilization protein n=1 Tax=unclassified Butyrivibrio TaxID=2639466 RepID=UPI000426AA57|nr:MULTISPECIES: plasmid mobilization relaxosome protein MobC [unclassified Butyrivibrio]